MLVFPSRLITILALAFLASELQAQPYELYILPPGDESWILGTPYLKVGEGVPDRLQMDDEHCGWFKKVYSSESDIPDKDAWIWLGAKKTDAVGVLGMKEDPTEYQNGEPTPFNLRQKFDAISSSDQDTARLYFFANEGEWKANIISTEITDDNKTRCEYNFAAIIYQRSKYENTGGFSWYTSGSDTRTFGICKGVVKETLGEDGKMQFNGEDCKNEAPYAANPNGSNWGSEENFKNAFKHTEGENEVKCWDMPFVKRPGGLWEFDAYYLCKDGLPDNAYTDYNSNTATKGCGGNGNVGGFYPGFGARANFDGQLVDVRENFKWCFDRGWSGSVSSSTGIGDLSGKTDTASLNAEMRRVCGASAALYPINSTAEGLINSAVPAHNPNYNGPNVALGGHICFESQDAEFTYEPGQEFFFRGDDDIWVFINKQLVVDLGGTHMPAPGYVKLDTIKTPEPLVAGEKYPIKIFFCDRRGPGSNVRISTNMYFSQKSGLSLKERTAQTFGDVCLETSGGGSCDALAGNTESTKKCGRDLKDQIIYYVQRRDGSGRQDLDTATTSGCTQTGSRLKCFGPEDFGITVDFSDGKVQVAPRSQGIVGTWVVYAAIKGDDKIAPLRLGTTTGITAIQVVWGNVVKATSNSTIETITNIPFKKDVSAKVGMEAVASRLVPVGFAEGAWTSGDSSATNATFEVDSSSAGKLVRIQTSSLKDLNVEGSYLMAYADSAGTEEVNLNADQKIPESGVLVLYFTGSFEAASTATYEINSSSTGDPFALKVHQPKFEFVNDSNEIIPENKRFGSDTLKLGSAKDKWVHVGTPIKRKIAAFDPTTKPMAICTTCTFKPEEINAASYVGKRNAEALDRETIQFLNRELENGLGSLTLASSKRIQLDNDSLAHFTVRGPSTDTSTIAKWDSLQFREPPVPYPISAEIFDRNGDGKGDSIRIVYNRTFVNADTLPNMVQVIWSLKDTIDIGPAKKDTASGKYTNAGIDSTEKSKFWKDYLRKGKCPATVKDCPDTLAIAVPYDSAAAQFSSDIKTAYHGIGETGEIVISWSTYKEDQSIESVTSGFSFGITDKISPIIVYAGFSGTEGGCGTDKDHLCADRVTIELSERVTTVTGATIQMAREAFAYKLLARGEDSQYGFEIPTEGKSYATSIRWAGRRDNYPEGDSIVVLNYASYKTENDNSYTPVPNDSVRLLSRTAALVSGNPLEHAFKDMADNFPNPREIGRRIEGKGRFSVDRNPIATVNPATAEDSLKQRIRNRFKGQWGDTLAGRIAEGNPINWLPIPESWKGDNLRDSLRVNYPSTVGPIFWPGAGTTISGMDKEYGSEIPRKNIFFVANSFYHTSLGNYVVKSGELRIPCDDPVFRVGGAKDCTESNNGIYVGWDLRDGKGRWVGTGVYVQVYNFYWEIKDVEPREMDGKMVNVNGVHGKYPDESNKIEMYGVRRNK
jgi:fibro-slime domain-containing protein